MCLKVSSLGGIQPCHRIRRFDECRLGRCGRQRDSCHFPCCQSRPRPSFSKTPMSLTRRPSVLIHSSATNDSPNDVAIPNGLVQGLDDDGHGALATPIAISLVVERLRLSVWTQEMLQTECRCRLRANNDVCRSHYCLSAVRADLSCVLFLPRYFLLPPGSLLIGCSGTRDGVQPAMMSMPCRHGHWVP